MSQLQPEAAVQQRYAAAAKAPEAALCCAVKYNPELLQVIPSEVIEKDYGCGDPSQHVRPGETVLDLGSGTGKICFIAAQIVGSTGRVIGVDMTDDMLEVARRNAPLVAERIGYANVEFRKGRIQDLALDIERFDAHLAAHPIRSAADYLAAEQTAATLRATHPLIPSESIDVVVSNCVLNLVESQAKGRLFAEIFRVLRQGGRAVISDIVSDSPVPQHLQQDARLWSGCISGALTEAGFLKAFTDAGFHGVQLLKRDETPWQRVEGIEFRSVTVQAFKDTTVDFKPGAGIAIYTGPFREVVLDSGQRLVRGQAYPVSEPTAAFLSREPYRDHILTSGSAGNCCQPAPTTGIPVSKCC